MTHLQVSYTPQDAGILTIYLGALNALSVQNITKQILVQNILKAAILYAVPWETFIHKTVKLMASVTPRPNSNSVECLWDFGDGSNPLHTTTTTVDYEYSHPGHYMVQVCVIFPVNSLFTVFVESLKYEIDYSDICCM